MPTLIAETVDLAQAVSEERALAPGAYEARLYIISPMGLEALEELHWTLLDKGVDVRGCVEQRANGLWQVRTRYMKGKGPGLLQSIPEAVKANAVGVALFAADGTTVMRKALMMAAGIALLLVLAKGIRGTT